MKISRLKLVGAVLAAVVLAIALSGCGGGGGGTTAAGQGVDITFGGSVVPGGSMGGLQQSRAIDLGVNGLTSGTINVYDFKTGELIETGTLVDGVATLTLTPGQTVVVVITGEKDGTPYRLSTIIPVVPTVDTDYVIDPATSIAAEALAEQYYKDGKVIDQASFDDVLADAQAYIAANPGAVFSLGGDVFGGTADDFGTEAGLDDTVEAALTVPTIDDNLAQAKNSVQQIREAGLPVQAMLADDKLGLEGLVTSEVIDKYSALGSRLSVLILPVLQGRMSLADVDVTINDLTVGNTYEVTENVSGFLTIADAGVGTAGRITFTFFDDPETYTLVVRQSGSNTIATQTFTGDPTQSYAVSFPTSLTLDANPSFTGTVSLTDSVFTTPLTFEGTVSAVGPNQENYRTITFTGTLDTPELDSTGTFSVEFNRTGIPDGAAEGRILYDYPTKVTMTNASIELHGTVDAQSFTITIRGDLTATTQLITVPGDVVIEPKSVTLEGSYSNSLTGLRFTGSITGEVDWVADGSNTTISGGSSRLRGTLTRDGHPTYSADLSFSRSGDAVSTEIDLRAGVYTLGGSGSGTINESGDVVNATITLQNQDGVQFIFRTDVGGVFSGEIKVDGAQQATITIEDVGGVESLKVTYTDATFEAFPI